MSVSAGCSSPVASGESSSQSVGDARQVTWEAGMILAGRPGYLCLSLEDIGLNSGDEILSLAASCECISPRVIKYQTAAGATVSGILLEYVDKADKRSVSSRSASHLGVVFTAMLGDGRTHEFTVNLLHTHLTEKVN